MNPDLSFCCQGRFEFFRRQVPQSQFDRFDQAFVGESDKVGAVFQRKLRRARGYIQQAIFAFDFLAIPERQRIQHEVQISVLYIVHRDLRGEPHGQGVVVAQVSKIGARADQRFHVHGKSAAVRRLQNFPQIGV